jgi:hypothetical protein
VSDRTLADKQALHELALTYCRACDRRDFALVRSLYHDDAVDDHGSMFHGTADEYVAWLPRVLSGFEATSHAVLNALYVVDGVRAEGEIYTLAYHRTHPPESQDVFIGGRYLDRYERRRGAWKIAHRSLALDWCRVESVDPGAYQAFAAGAPLGRPDASDPSYRALAYFARRSEHSHG